MSIACRDCVNSIHCSIRLLSADTAPEVTSIRSLVQISNCRFRRRIGKPNLAPTGAETLKGFAHLPPGLADRNTPTPAHNGGRTGSRRPGLGLVSPWFRCRQGRRTVIGLTRTARWREVPAVVANRPWQTRCPSFLLLGAGCGTPSVRCASETEGCQC
jgi:hypothetical protein